MINDDKIRDYGLLFKKFKSPRKIYKRDLAKSERVSKEIEKYNHNFSTLMFSAWVQNLFTRYALLVSEGNESKILGFEKIHFNSDKCMSFREDINLYDYYKSVNVEFLDFIDYIHIGNNKGKLSLVINVVCKMPKDNHIEEQKSYYYYIDFELDDNEEKSRVASYTSNCPNCGAPTSIVTFGECDSCHQFVSIYDNVWKITNIKFDY